MREVPLHVFQQPCQALRFWLGAGIGPTMRIAIRLCPQCSSMCLCLGTFGDPRRVDVSDERGSPVPGGARCRAATTPRAAARSLPALEATQGQMDGFVGQHLYKCQPEEVVSVGN
jgi:hypothetical protein